MTQKKIREIKAIKNFINNLNAESKCFYIDNEFQLDICIRMTRQIEIRVRGKEIIINVCSFNDRVDDRNTFNKFVNKLSEARAIVNMLKNKVNEYYMGLETNEKIMEVV